MTDSGGQSVSTIQIINGQPLLQAKVQHILTPGGPMAVAVVPSSLSSVLSQLLQQYPQNGIGKNQTLVLNMAGGSAVQAGLADGSAPSTSTAAAGAKEKPSGKGRSSRQRRGHDAKSTGRAKEYSVAKGGYAPIKPKGAADSATNYFPGQDGGQSVLLSAHQMQSPVQTVQLNEFEQHEYNAITEQMLKVTALAGIGSSVAAYDEMVLKQLEQKRRSILERAASEQFRVSNHSGAQGMLTQAPVVVHMPPSSSSRCVASTSTTTCDAGALPQFSTIPCLNNNSIGVVDAPTGVQQLVQINGNTYLIVQPKNVSVQPQQQNALFVQTNFGPQQMPPVEQKHGAAPLGMRSESINLRSAKVNSAPSTSALPRQREDKPSSSGTKEMDPELLRMCEIVQIHKDMVADPDISPFVDEVDVLCRLQPYYLLEEENVPDEILASTDDLYKTKMNILLSGVKGMCDHVRYHLIREAAYEVPPSDFALLNRLFIEGEYEQEEEETEEEEEEEDNDERVVVEDESTSDNFAVMGDNGASSECLSRYLMALHEPHSPLKDDAMVADDYDYFQSESPHSSCNATKASDEGEEEEEKVEEDEKEGTNRDQSSSFKIVIKLGQHQPMAVSSEEDTNQSADDWSSEDGQSSSQSYPKVPPLKLCLSKNVPLSDDRSSSSTTTEVEQESSGDDDDESYCDQSADEWESVESEHGASAAERCSYHLSSKDEDGQEGVGKLKLKLVQAQRSSSVKNFRQQNGYPFSSPPAKRRPPPP